MRLDALRVYRPFRPSLLGKEATKWISSLSSKIRQSVLQEIVLNSGMDGLDLATASAKEDPDPEVKVAVVNALTFRLAHRHVTDLLHGEDETIFDLMARMDLINYVDVDDEQIKIALDTARERQRKQGTSSYERLQTIVYGKGDQDLSNDLVSIISEMEIDQKQDGKVHLVYEARNRYPHAVADGLLQRVRAGRTLFYGTADLLASADLILEDKELLDIALSDMGCRDKRAEASASVLGPLGVGSMIEAVLAAKKNLRNGSGRYNQAAGDRYHDLLARIRHTPITSLVNAVRDRSPHAGIEEMADLAELISRRLNSENDHSNPFGDGVRAVIGMLAEEWGSRMLASDRATRSQLSSIARLISSAPSLVC